jgi:CBS domain-containing protein
MKPTASTSTPVRERMTTELIKLTADTTLHNAEKLLKRHHIRHAPVVEGKKLIGIISLTDIQRLTFGSPYGEPDPMGDRSLADMLSVGQVMHTHPDVIAPETTIQEAARKLIDAEYHALPVVKDGELQGILTTTDLLKLLVEE